ncbi:flagellar hook-length control protein FliK [Geobacter pelophilus]|uniref:Flagellar hook-length control protein FliK n=1 Tax=Geoanaerobacter pelophilus TaxID=60036 RepID=A0AAW4L6T5_9BACT|nr:flagellar hook-length control protein FliK [Geoanaerobacter pelophilus]MBT0663966.1 flagellar hook-length control protein FliK [Geoanaerobacter pelophilus]
MDIMNVMMNSMTQSSAMLTATGGAPAQGGTAGADTGKSALFSTLLGSMQQSQLAALPPQAAVEGDVPAMDIKTLMALLQQVAQGGTETAEQPADGMPAAKEFKALSLVQLLNGLKDRLEAPSAEMNQAKTQTINAEGIEQLVAELRTLFGQEGESLPKISEKLLGRLSPELTEKIGAALGQKTQEVTDEVPQGQEQDAKDQLMALLTAISGLLSQSPRQAPEKKVETGEESAMPGIIPVVTAEQKKSTTATVADAVTMQKRQDPAAVMAADAEVKAVNPEPEKLAKTFAGPDSTPVAEPVSQAKVVKPHNAPVQILPTALPVSLPEEIAVDQPQEKINLAAIDLVVTEEEAMLEMSQPEAGSQKSEAAANRELPKSESVFALTADGKSQLIANDRPVAESSSTTVTREQIVSQVKEKLAEHRITQDNGQVTIRLNPAELGELKINVRMDDQRLRIEIVAENRTVKDALMENLGTLKEALARQNIEMKQFDVSTGSKQFFHQGFREGRQQEQQYVAPRQAGWLTGNTAALDQSAPAVWQPRANALLDMVM